MDMKLGRLVNSGGEGDNTEHKSRGNTRPEHPPLGECAVALGRYAVLFSTASRPFRLSALQNACVCPCMGAWWLITVVYSEEFLELCIGNIIYTC